MAAALTRTLLTSRKEVEGLAEVADGEIGLTGAVLALELELAIATRGRDREGAPSDLDGLKVLAGDVPEPRADIGKDSPQASRISEPGRQVFGFAHDGQSVMVSPEWDEREPQLESCVDGLREGLRGLGQPFECLQRLPDQPGRCAV